MAFEIQNSRIYAALREIFNVAPEPITRLRVKTDECLPTVDVSQRGYSHLRSYHWISGPLSINGAPATFRIGTTAVVSEFGTVPSADERFIIRSAVVTVSGGITTPVTGNLQAIDPSGQGYEIWRGSITNPGQVTIGPFWKEPKFDFALTVSAGGAGDQFTFQGMGHVAIDGEALP